MTTSVIFFLYSARAALKAQNYSNPSQKMQQWDVLSQHTSRSAFGVYRASVSRDKDLEVLQRLFACRWKLPTNRMGPGRNWLKSAVQTALRPLPPLR
jgi:hypothetical protein